MYTYAEELTGEEDFSEWEALRDEIVSAEASAEPDGETPLFGVATTGVGDHDYTEREPNNTMSTANRIYDDYTVSGTLSRTDRLDYFKFVLSQRSKVEILSVATRRNFMIGIVDTTGEALAVGVDLGYDNGTYGDALTCTLNPGTYYVAPLDTDGNANTYVFYISITPVSSHTHNYTYSVVVTPPTCTEQGYTTYTCSCGSSYKDDYTDPTGHSFGEWTETKAPAGTEPGEKTRTCSVCGEIETEEIPHVEHEFGDWSETKAATCTEKGEETRTCTCGLTETREIPAAGHNWEHKHQDGKGHYGKILKCNCGWSFSGSDSNCTSEWLNHIQGLDDEEIQQHTFIISETWVTDTPEKDWDECTVCGEMRNVVEKDVEEPKDPETPKDPEEPKEPETPKDPETPEEPQETVDVFRLYNPNTLEHLLTSNPEERDALVGIGWSLDGTAWKAPTSGTRVYRLYNPFDDFHFYTTSQEEIDTLTPLGWTVDGAVSYSASAEDGAPVYRLFNPYEAKNYHIFTASEEERDMLVEYGWRLEGVAWYCVKN